MLKINDKIREQINAMVYAAASQLMASLFDTIIVSISEIGPPRSEPGEPPHVDTATLIMGFVLENEGYFSFQISSPDEYSIFLEMGSWKLEPRPFLFPAVFQVQANYDSILRHSDKAINFPRVWHDVAM